MFTYSPIRGQGEVLWEVTFLAWACICRPCRLLCSTNARPQVQAARLQGDVTHLEACFSVLVSPLCLRNASARVSLRRRSSSARRWRRRRSRFRYRCCFPLFSALLRETESDVLLTCAAGGTAAQETRTAKALRSAGRSGSGPSSRFFSLLRGTSRRPWSSSPRPRALRPGPKAPSVTKCLRSAALRRPCFKELTRSFKRSTHVLAHGKLFVKERELAILC